MTKLIEDRIQRWLVDYPVGYATDVSEHDLLREAAEELRRLRGALEAADRLCDAIRFATPDVLPPHRRHDVVEVHKVVLSALRSKP